MSAAAGEGMEVGAQAAEGPGVIGMGRDRLLEEDEGRPVGSGVGRAQGGKVTEDTDALEVLDGEAGSLEDRAEPDRVEPARQRVARPPPSVLARERCRGLGEVTGEHPREDDGEPTGDSDGQVPTGGECGRDGGQRRLRVVDDLEDPVTADEVEPGVGTHVGQDVGVALSGRDAVGDARLSGPSFEGGEGVGAGVDDGDLMPELGKRYGEPAGATAEVEDLQWSSESVPLGSGEVFHGGGDDVGAPGHPATPPRRPPLLGHVGLPSRALS